MCGHTCEYIHVWTYVCVHTYVGIRVCTYMCGHTCVYMYVWTYVWTYVCVPTRSYFCLLTHRNHKRKYYELNAFYIRRWGVGKGVILEI
jgi:hypothetical protein